jgi:DNA replication protein DnaC
VVIHNCETCNDVRLVIRARVSTAVAERCKCMPTGACCVDGYVIDVDRFGYSVASRCPVCAEPERRRALFNAASIPRRFHRSAFHTFDPSAANRHARARAYSFAQEFSEGDPGLLFYGDPGRGKTHLLIGILRHLVLHRGIEARYVEFMHLLSDLRATYSGGNPTPVMAPLLKVPVLVVDELGKGRSAKQSESGGKAPAVSEWVGDVLDELISKRYNSGRTTLFATNYYPGNPAPGQQPLNERIGARMYSRLMEMCESVHLAGDDYRKLRAERRV